MAAVTNKIITFLSEFINYLTGDCSTCEHEEQCSYIQEGTKSCWDAAGFEPHYKKKEEKTL